MHTLFDVTGILVVILMGSSLVLGQLQSTASWSQRRTMQLLILAMPLVSLAVLASGLRHVLDPGCILSAPYWDHVLDLTVLLLVSFTLIGACGFGGLRLFLMKRVMARQEFLVDPALQALADRLAQEHGRTRLRVRLSDDTHPLAFLYGMRHPTVLLSTWMVEHLDQEELEAVLAHELEHVARRDYLVNWFAMILRDAFFYLPTSRIAYRQLAYEKELACDDLASGTTRQPLALASAITKVWLNLSEGPPSPLVQSLVLTHESIEARIQRLLTRPSSEMSQPQESLLTPSVKVSLGILFVVIGVGIALMVALFRCWPGFVA